MRDRRLLVALVVLVAVPACRGCDGCDADTPAPNVVEVPSAVVPTIAQTNRRHAGERLTAAAVHPDGRVALFGRSGAFAITDLSDPNVADPETSTTGSPVMDADWIGDRIVGLETAPPALVLWDGQRELSRAALEGTPVDLLVDAERSAVWAVLRVDGGAVVHAYAVNGSEFAPRVEHRIGEQPVGLWSGHGSIYAPTFLDRTVTVFSSDSLSWTASVPVQSRPLSIYAAPGGPAVIGANSDIVQLVTSDQHRLVEMPAPLWIAEELGGLYAFSAKDSTLRRLDPETLEVLSSSDEFGLVSDIASSSLGLVVVDAGEEPRVVVVDEMTLTEVASARVEGRPDRVVETALGRLVVVSPAEGVVTSFEVSAVADTVEGMGR